MACSTGSWVISQSAVGTFDWPSFLPHAFFFLFGFFLKSRCIFKKNSSKLEWSRQQMLSAPSIFMSSAKQQPPWILNDFFFSSPPKGRMISIGSDPEQIEGTEGNVWIGTCSRPTGCHFPLIDMKTQSGKSIPLKQWSSFSPPVKSLKRRGAALAHI